MKRCNIRPILVALVGISLLSLIFLGFGCGGGGGGGGGISEPSLPETLDDYINRIPEVYSGNLTHETKEIYRNLIQPIWDTDGDAAKWVLNMGQFLEDLTIDQKEITLLDMLSNANIYDPLIYLTAPWILDCDITEDDIMLVQEGYPPRGDFLYLDEHIDELVSLGLLSTKAVSGLSYLVDKAAEDFELRKGLYLVFHFGKPDRSVFAYDVPEFNTQLYVLGKLLDKGLIDGHERHFVAAALIYGSLFTISDSQIQARIPDYAYARIQFTVETDQMIGQKGGSWQARENNLEQNISLLWGLPGNEYQDDDFLGGFFGEFRTRQFNDDDWNWSVLKTEYYTEMRNYLLNQYRFSNIIGNGNLDQLANEMFQFWYIDTLDYQGTGGNPCDYFRIEVYGRNVHASYISTMNYQWELFKSEGRFIGTSGESYIDFHLKQALSWSPIMMHYWLHTSGYSDLQTATWKASSDELAIQLSAGHIIDDLVGYNTLIWDNFWGVTRYTNEDPGQRSKWLSSIPIEQIVSNGIPTGYLFRKDQAHGDVYCYD
jgi:hypothetical protein